MSGSGGNHGERVRRGNETQKDDIVRMAAIAEARGNITVFNKGRVIGPEDRDKIHISKDLGNDAEFVTTGASKSGATRRQRNFLAKLGKVESYGL